MLAKPLAACTHLSLTVSQLFEPQVQKIAVFTYSTLHFCFPCDYHAICCMDGKTIQCLSNPSQHVPICLQQFPSYSNRKCKNSPFSRTAAYDVDMAIWHVVSFVNRDNFMVLICAIRFYGFYLNKCKKLQFIHKLTASDTSKTAKITKR